MFYIEKNRNEIYEMKTCHKFPLSLFEEVVGELWRVMVWRNAEISSEITSSTRRPNME